jgi:hypothetical protein
MGLYQIKKSCTSKETIMRMKRQLIKWEKIFVNYSSDKDPISRIYKMLKKISTKRTNNQINKWAN